MQQHLFSFINKIKQIPKPVRDNILHPVMQKYSASSPVMRKSSVCHAELDSASHYTLCKEIPNQVRDDDCYTLRQFFTNIFSSILVLNLQTGRQKVCRFLVYSIFLWNLFHYALLCLLD